MVAHDLNSTLGKPNSRITAVETSLGALVSARQDLSYQGHVSKQNNKTTPQPPKDPKIHLIII